MPSYPTADISTGSWVASSGALYSCVDEPTTPNTSDYVETGVPSTPWVAGITPTLSAGAHDFKVHAKGPGTLTVKLRDSSSVLATATQALTGTWTTYTLNMTIASTADRYSLEVS